VGGNEILEIYLNSVSKNTSETEFFLHGTKYLFPSVIVKTTQHPSQQEFSYFLLAKRKQETNVTEKLRSEFQEIPFSRLYGICCCIYTQYLRHFQHSHVFWNIHHTILIQ
jgi:hypothetical protein